MLWVTGMAIGFGVGEWYFCLKDEGAYISVHP